MMCRERLNPRSQNNMGYQKNPSYFPSFRDICVSFYDSLWSPLNCGRFFTSPQCQLLPKVQTFDFCHTENIADELGSSKSELLAMSNLYLKRSLYSENSCDKTLINSAFDLKQKYQLAVVSPFHFPFRRFSHNLIDANIKRSKLPNSSVDSCINAMDVSTISIPEVVEKAEGIRAKDRIVRLAPHGAITKCISLTTNADKKCMKLPISSQCVFTVNLMAVQNSNEIVLNQQLMQRKNRKMSKVSKKRRRRQKKQQKAAMCVSSGEDHEEIMRSEKGLDCDISSHNEKNKTGAKESSESNRESITLQVSSSRSCDNFVIDVECKSPIVVQSQCTNPQISFILGHSISSASEDDDSDFENCDVPDRKFCFMDCLVNGVASLCVDTVPAKNNRSRCLFSVIELGEMPSELKLVNKRWNQRTRDIDITRERYAKVTFAKDNELATVFPVEIYDRKGEWESYALERFRFKRRIEEMERILSPIFATSHRKTILQRLKPEE